MAEKKPLTRRQIEALEAAYHGRNLYHERPMGTKSDGSIFWSWSSGNATVRMVQILDDRGYIGRRAAGKAQLTTAGYFALSQDKKAMQHIDPAELSARMKAQAKVERDAENAQLVKQEERRRAEAAAEAQSRKDRLAKLRELDQGNGRFEGDSDDELLAFAERVREIMDVY